VNLFDKIAEQGVYHTCEIAYCISRKTWTAAAAVGKQGIKKQTAYAPANTSIKPIQAAHQTSNDTTEWDV
jgi:hypothetical protein